MVATLTRQFGDLDVAEEATAEAFAAGRAYEHQWEATRLAHAAAVRAFAKACAKLARVPRAPTGSSS